MTEKAYSGEDLVVPPRPISEFASNYGDQADIFAYPGDFPGYSYFTDGKTVASMSGGGVGELKVFNGTEWLPLDDILANSGVEPISGRIPVVAYGANQNPASLIEKFASGNSNDQILPVLNGKMYGFVPAAHGKPGIKGNVFAELIRHDGAVASIKVVMLSKRQLALLHSTEPSYDVGILRGSKVVLATGEEIPALVYAGDAPAYLDADGRPILYSNITVGGVDNSLKLTSREMLEHMLNVDGVRDAIAAVAPEIIEYGYDADAYARSMSEREPLRTRAEVQKAVRSALERAGRIGQSSLSETIEPISRSLLDTAPTLAQMLRGEVGLSAVVNSDGTITQPLGRMAVQFFPRPRNPKEAKAIEDLKKYWHSKNKPS